LSGSGRYTRYTDELGNQIPATVLPPGQSAAIILREKEVATLNGTLLAPIDLNGELWAALAAAQAGYRGERAREWATLLEQQLAAVRAYFQLLEAQRLHQVTAQTIAVDREQLAHAEALLGSGRATKNDTLVARVALSAAEQQLRQRELAIRQSKWLLNQLIGRSIDAPTTIADVQQRPVLPAVEQVLQSAHQHNPLLLTLLEELQRLEANATALRRGRLPRFYGGGAFDYTSSDILQPQEMASGYIGFSWDLGTDTRREAQIAQAQAALDQTRLVLERQLREIEAAVRTTYEAAAERLSALDSAAAAVSQAEENLRIRQQQYTAGRAQSDDVLSAEALLAQQRATLAGAIYQAQTRRAELQQLMGLPIEDLLPEWR
ncbi:MAG TPA: TolC family protein, partial [Terriglobales bacterium]|nr:TolC family protein [Terriglobales bacterium]